MVLVPSFVSSTELRNPQRSSVISRTLTRRKDTRKHGYPVAET